MKVQRAIKDVRGESLLFRYRALTGFLLILLGLGALITRFVFLQVVHYDDFAARSQQNRIKPRAIPPARGLIYDRHGVLLADNVPAFRLEVIPEKVQHMKEMLTRLNEIVPLSQDDLEVFRKQLKQSRDYESIPLKLRLNEDEIDRFAINQWRFPGVSVVPYLTRRYPYGALLAHVVGYVGRIDADDLKRLDPARYKGTTHVGRRGIEHFYENLLHGQPGYELVEVNADGRVQRTLETHLPTPGKNLYLSIDVRLQKAAMAALNGRPGAAVAIDPRNGQVLAMVSVPSFDPNLFVNGISRDDYKALITNPERPLLNRALSGIYPHGSTVKPLLGLAGLEYGLRTPKDTVVSTGQFFIPGQSRAYRDDQRWGVGRVNLMQAIEQSVNTYFYKLALDMGIDRLSEFMRRFGFGKPTGIDLDGEVSGVLPSREWKYARYRQPWYPGETVIAGIGQGYWAVTPIQLAHAIATLANHGIPYQPRLLLATQVGINGPLQPQVNPPSGPSLIHKKADWDAINQGMEMVIYGKGTGSGLGQGFPYLIAGKSGTAELYSRTSNSYDENKSNAYLASRHRAWFVAYTPADHPQIAVAVVLEAGAWGAKDAGPIVRKILDAWLATQVATHPMPVGASSAAPRVTAAALAKRARL